ncbi:hypothetical protein [Desulfolutivibrio sulfoxidireducens]|uniref:hypothetical protein n=1 Tax=Desulfolutivibrio sulfoxidireducens TaxID=2773299 RepID=UPI00159D73D5|nr:hypothetical protein [Desulfolutivibrio sulfoxidireducens]QLA15242.1 hypothetical protein GD605_03355 [Desulfolutivibrio sulfoxidireducens]
MEISGNYNEITRLMTLLGTGSDETTETESSKSSESASSSSSTTKSSSALGDLVTLSENGYDLSGLAGSLVADKTVLDSLEEQTSAIEDQFLAALNEKLEEAGVDTSTAITLKRNADGTIEVANDHPDKETIEALFEEEPVLAEAFNAIADQSELARKIKSERSVMFSRAGGFEAYAKCSLTSDSSSDTDSYYLSLLGDSVSSWFSSE